MIKSNNFNKIAKSAYEEHMYSKGVRHPDRFSGLPSLLSKGYWTLFPRG